MKKKMRLEVVLDIVCPWCFVGKENLYRAMEQLSEEFDFDLEFLPFQLDPNISTHGENRLEYFSKKFGDLQRFAEAEAHVKVLGLEAGVQMNFEKIQKNINTFECHRLVHFAHRFGLQKDVVDALFYNYFTEGRDLTNRGYLLKIGLDAGLPEDELTEYLESETGKAEVDEKISLVYSMGVNGVPFTVINRSLAVSGAQSVESFMGALSEAAAGM